MKLKDTPQYLRNNSKSYWFDYSPKHSLIYFQYNVVEDTKEENFAAFVNRLFDSIDNRNVQRLIIDLRNNGGGNSLLLPPLVKTIVEHKSINKRGNLFVISSRRSFSAAQQAITMLERNTNAIIVGEPSGSSPNNVGESRDMLQLPYSKVWINVSDLYWQSAWPQDRRTWVQPFLYAAPKFEYLRNGIDPYMVMILKYIQLQKVAF